MKVSRLTKVEVLLCLSVLKPPHAKWIVEIYNDMTTSKFKDVIANGWKSSGITEALKSGKNDFGDLGLFSDTELLLDSTPHSPHSPDVGQQIPSAAETEMIFDSQKLVPQIASFFDEFAKINPAINSPANYFYELGNFL